MRSRKLTRKQVLEIGRSIYKDLASHYGPAVKTREDRVRVLADIIMIQRYPSCTTFTRRQARWAADQIVEP